MHYASLLTHWGLTSILLFTGIGSVQAQVLRGRVLDDQDQALIGVNVFITHEDRGTTTDLDGRFEIENLSPGQHHIRFSFIGYETQTRVVNLEREPVVLDVVLQSTTVGLDEVTVETVGAERDLKLDARSVGVLTVEDLAQRRGQTLGETLEAIPGVTTMETGPAISKPVIRGLRGERVVIVNAGLTQQGQQWGDEHAPEIDPFAPAQIEVLKGAASVEYGAGAIGGVIRIEPPPLRTAPGFDGTVTLSGFSNNRQGATAFEANGGTDWIRGLGWRAHGSFRRAGDARTPDYIIGNSGFAQVDGAVTLGLERERLHTEVVVSRFFSRLGVYKGAHIGNLSDLERAIARGEPLVEYDFGYEIGNPKQEVQHDVVTGHAEYTFPSGDRLEGRYGLQRNIRQEFDAHRRFGGEEAIETPAIDLRLLAHTADLRFRHRPIGNWTGVIGLDGLRQGNVNRESGYLIPNFRAYTGGAFVRETWATDRWVVDTGVRFSYRWLRAHPRIDREFVRRFHEYRDLAGALGVIYQFARTWSIGLNASTGWRPPGVNELYNEGVHHGTAQFEIGDPDLEGERSLNTDATLRHVSDRVQLELSVYNNQMRNFIFLFPSAEPTLTIRGAFPTFAYRQADAVLRGLDGAVTWTAAQGLELGLQAGLVRGTNLDTDEPLISMPADRLMLDARFDLPDFAALSGMYLEAGSRLVRKQDRVPADADYAPPPSGYALFDVGYGGEMLLGRTPVRFSVRVQNLFNTTYRDYLSRFRYFINEAGRSVVVNLNIPFGNQAQ